MIRRPARFAPAVLACLSLLAPSAAQEPSGKIVDHPSQLEFDDFPFTPPEASEHRHRLSNGVSVYVVEDHSLPLVDLEVKIRVGTYVDPNGTGVAEATGDQLRAGGTETQPPDAFDEEVEFLAAEISSSVGDTEGHARFNCLRKDLDRVLALFFEMLRRPRFDAGRLAIYKSQVLQAMAQRNDATLSIETREWQRLLLGDDHFSRDRRTKASIDALERDDLLAFHTAHFHPRSFILAVSGNVIAAEILPKLEEVFRDWKSPPSTTTLIPQETKRSPAGLYLVHKEGVNQGRVVIGHPGVRRGHPDEQALRIMNHILGGGGFVSRITSRVRSDEGLAYTAGSVYRFGIHHDGFFRVVFQSKSAAVAQAVVIVLEELERIRTDKVGDEELTDAIQYFVESFPRQFQTAARIADILASDELTGRPESFWRDFRTTLRAVTTDDVLRVAREHLQVDRLIFLVVGDSEEILAGNPDAPQFSLKKAAGKHGTHRIPLPDPMTLEYPPVEGKKK